MVNENAQIVSKNEIEKIKTFPSFLNGIYLPPPSNKLLKRKAHLKSKI
jgi:hypothetical protein